MPNPHIFNARRRDGKKAPCNNGIKDGDLVYLQNLIDILKKNFHKYNIKEN